MRAARNGQIGSARGLDAPLKPIYRVAPVYPAQIPEASRVAGEATIDIVVDRDGLVRLPRVVAASRPEFGWAAMTALAQWVFQPPMRHGTQVDVNVRIPVKFAAPN